MKRRIVVFLCVVCLAAVVGLLYGQSQDKELSISEKIGKLEKDYGNVLLRVIVLENKVKKLEKEPETKPKEADSKSDAEAPAETPEEKFDPKKPFFRVTLVKKGFRPADYSANPLVPAANTLTVSFVNLTGKNIRAFDGYFRFTDLLGNTIYKVSAAINDPVASGKTLVWNGEVSFNQFKDDDRRWRNAEPKNIKIEFVCGKILFADGEMWRAPK